MHLGEDITYDTPYYTVDTFQAINQNGDVLMTFPASSATITTNVETFPTWTDSTTTYGVEFNNDYIAISKDLSEKIRKLGYNLNLVNDAFTEFCARLIDLHEDMRLDEAFHDSEDLDDFLKEFIVNNKKN